MSRRKSITIARKPIARTQPIGADAARGISVAETVPGDTAETTSASFGIIGKAVYGAVFCLTYGVVFSALAIGTLVPGKRIIGQAMVDATASARRVFSGAKQRRKNPRHAAQTPSATAQPGAGIEEAPGFVA